MDVFDLVAKIRLDSSEYEQGVGKAKGTFSTLASGVKTGLATVTKIGAAAVSAGVAGVAALTKMGIDGYKQYEQLAGGAELLWGDAYDFIADKASGAYATVQMSQNDYLQQVNGFSTGLKTSLGGNVQAAAELADRIITAEADIVAATGNTQENVQNAFNGIMKSNFSMLDNLQLGITPTKEGFQEVIDKVNEWNTANGEATNYQISNLADCQSALLDYIEMQGLSGYAAMEASKTIEGSISMMKAAWSNLVVGMADENADMETLINNFVESTATAAQNLLPRIEQTLKGIGQLITALAPVIAEALPVLIEAVLPSLLSAGVSLVVAIVNGIITALPGIYTALLEGVQIILVEVFGVSEEKAGEFADGINSFFVSIKDGFVWLVETAQTEGTLLNQVWEGLKTAFEFVKDALIFAFDAVKNAFTWCAEQINTDGTWLNETWVGIKDAVQALFDFISAAFDAISAAFTWCVEQINTDGTYLNMLWENLKAVATAVWDQIKNMITTVTDAIKSIFKVFTSVLKGDWSAAWNEIKNLAQIYWDYIKNVFSIATNLLKNLVGNAWNHIKSVTSSVWDGIKSAISSVWDGIKSAVSSAINGVKSTVSDVWNGIKSTTVTVWNAIKSAITTPINKAWELVSGVIEKLKSAFDFEWSLPDLKLPHISVSGGKAPYGIGGKGSLPSFNIEWYKKAYDNAMILSSPTIFGYSNGKFLGGGDGNGNEVVAGESYLMGLISNAVESKNERIVVLLSALLEATVDGNGEMVRALMADRTFAVGEREFARLVRTYA